MKNYQSLNYEGCVLAVGGVIKSAIQDAGVLVHKDTCRTIVLEKHRAREFLFNEGTLERFFDRYGLRDHANIPLIREMARKQIQERKYEETNQP